MTFPLFLAGKGTTEDRRSEFGGPSCAISLLFSEACGIVDPSERALSRSIERESRRRIDASDATHETHSERNTETRKEQKGEQKGGKEEARYFGGYARGPCRAIKLRNGGSPLDVWRELHSLVKASRNSRRYRHRRGYINVSSYVLTAYPSSPPLPLSLSLWRSSPCASYVHRGMRAYAPPSFSLSLSLSLSPRRSLLAYIMRSGRMYIARTNTGALFVVTRSR